MNMCRSSKLWFQKKQLVKKKLVRAAVKSYEFMKKNERKKTYNATVQELKIIGLGKQTKLKYKIKKKLEAGTQK